ncbi:PASTA domain-containing protein [Dactylosporangium sp. NPDC049140]|uniref:Stk1 family PASTA domain-containing Ser/Thr kinase n=1 Tax=Dactylosporangium sp. NPDC049140 TaxID=3155647 RepID=UPI0033F766C8
MSTSWVVTTAAERIALDDAKQGETTFTVTNPGTRADRAVFEVVPGDSADPAWFTVDQPQRQVAASGSASFLLAVAVPAGAAPGTYEVRGRVYSSSEAPEESSVLSNRVVFDVAAPPAAPRRRIPLWIIAVAAGLVVVTGIVVTLVVTLGGGDGQAGRPQPAVAGSGPATVPDVTQLNEAQAAFELRRSGLVPGLVKHRNDSTRNDTVVEQSVKAGSTLQKGDAVGLVIAVRLAPPVPKTADNATISLKDGKLEWDQAEPYVTHWSVAYWPKICIGQNQNPPTLACAFVSVAIVRVDARSAVPPLQPARSNLSPAPYDVYNLDFDGTFQWTVAAVDDFGIVGPASPVRTGTLGF